VRVGIAITKSTSFRSVPQEFSNVYYYDGLSGTPTTAQADALVDEIATKEKTFHSVGVTFVRGRVWSQIGAASANEMLTTKNLSGSGSMANVNAFDKERAFLFRLRAGSDSRGNPVYLRKWYHSCGQFDGGVAVAPSHLDQTLSFTTGERNTMAAKMGSLGSVGAGATLGTICAKGGRLSTAGASWSAHAWLEHHQLGDMWRQ
jgi:hypothetical protein